MAGGGEPSRSASTIVANTASGYHILRIDGYSRTLATPTGEYIASLPFTVGGLRWHIRYYPNGNKSEDKDGISLFLYLHDSVAKPVKAQFGFRFVGDVAEQPLTLGGMHIYDNQSAWGRPQFIKREVFEASKHLLDDSFAIRCDVVVTTEFRTEEAPEATTPADSISVPPSDLHQHLGGLLLNEKGADVVFDVAGEMFAAHRCVLAARSPVFSAELFGAMKESNTGGGVVHIEDMEPRVFKALLYFVYTDLFPMAKKNKKPKTTIKTKKMKQMEEGDVGDDEEDVLSQHLLVAADKYNLERLKLLCEKKLCDYINADNVATILALAEQHHCHGLKKENRRGVPYWN
ncbi:hypothetical protein BDA96_01G191200 [Sorghum bicolor]|uniref:BTB domain-containing protein n=2 Tax=Sorghum bicolor TaxID=4558 RepID=A0A1B6QJL5_SORBI|nr:hypothetical protein BDA96_01G191200 [Sorghum bicolor]KXG38113.1 hypothetical protein SORBI_3001G182000 [Sorghum bicolor]KXG38114.1 hypothetical protein SORBI_3001G182000 [Sorghum bicolor]